jgi:hypothetical protein
MHKLLTYNNAQQESVAFKVFAGRKSMPRKTPPAALSSHELTKISPKLKKI